MLDARFVDERTGKEFTLAHDGCNYRGRSYEFRTERCVKKEDFFTSFYDDEKKIPILLQLSSKKRDFQIMLEQIDSVVGIRSSMNLELSGKARTVSGDFCYFTAHYDYDMHRGEINLMMPYGAAKLELSHRQSVMLHQDATKLTKAIPVDKLFNFFMRERTDSRTKEQILLYTEDNKCLLLKSVLMLRKLETKSGKRKLQMEAEAQINFRDKVLKFVI